MSAITTHVLDTTHGSPAAGVRVTLEQASANEQWHVVGHGATDANGRLRTLLAEAVEPLPGLYRLTFDCRAYFGAKGIRPFFPHVAVTFEIVDGAAHYHLPLLLSPFGYTAYRGS